MCHTCGTNYSSPKFEDLRFADLRFAEPICGSLTFGICYILFVIAYLKYSTVNILLNLSTIEQRSFKLELSVIGK
jgi:hypothetical protein